jgi:SNF2 family DNA or RNA helicase
LINLWAQVWFLDGGARLGRTFSDFEQRWFRTAPNGYGLVPLPNADEEIHERIRDICLTIDPKDWFSLREPIRQRIEVELPARARKLYRDMERDLFLRISDTEVEAMSAASKSIKCLQLANGAIYLDDAGAWVATHDEKLDALEDIIEEASGMPVLVAYHFKSDLARLQHRFPKARVLKTTKDEDDFKAGMIPILLCHPESAGHGIDGFQYATNILAFFGHWWDLEPRQQMIERIGPVRQMQAGLDRPVFIYDIVAKDTIDEQVMLRHETKREVQDILLDALRDNERIFS